MKDFLFTSESVSEGHPDKIADQISDNILDAVLDKDPLGRVACETMVTTGLVIISGEITSKYYPDYKAITRKLIQDIGYNDSELGFDYKSCGILVSVDRQSSLIATGVDSGGAGDQGMMFGYATNETDELMPYPILLAHKITKRLSALRKSGEMPFLRPDSKAQVTIEYKDNKPVKIHTIVIAVQHTPNISQKELYNKVYEQIIIPLLPEDIDSKNIKFILNACGSFTVGGPHGDCGLTGRKIIVDTYGGFGRHGGGAFSGKDPSKVDRSAAYMARYVSKNIVASGLADRCEVQFAYVIGIAEPVSIYINTYNTGKLPDIELTKLIKDKFDLTPKGIISRFELTKPIYLKTASYGHFGRKEFPWENTKDCLNLTK